MERDEAKYLLALYELSGNPAILNQAIEKLSSVFEEASEPTLRSLLGFELISWQYKEGFEAGFGDLESAYQEAVGASLKHLNYERAATVNGRFFALALDSLHLSSAIATLKVAREFRESDPTVKNILVKERESFIRKSSVSGFGGQQLQEGLIIARA